jgi:putative ABC transport system substrate-binding protein
MVLVGDPVGSGIVANLAHPGGNVTGLSVMMPELNAKRLELLKEAIPQVARVAVFWNPDTPWHPKAVEEIKTVAHTLYMELSFISVRTQDQLGSAFAAASRAHAQAIYIFGDAFFGTRRATLLNLASKVRLPVVYGEKRFVTAGALMSYGPNYGDAFRRSAGYVDKILKGAKPGDLPVEQPTEFELVLNLKTAKALGLTLSQTILQRADELVQ